MSTVKAQRIPSTRFVTCMLSIPMTNSSSFSGADAVEQILNWKDVDRLWDMTHFIAVSRPGHELSLSGLSGEHVSLLEVPALAISSTDCRARVGRGFPVWYLVPDGVVQYIAKHNLYTEKAADR